MTCLFVRHLCVNPSWQKDFQAKGLSFGGKLEVYVNATAFSFYLLLGNSICLAFYFSKHVTITQTWIFTFHIHPSIRFHLYFVTFQLCKESMHAPSSQVYTIPQITLCTKCTCIASCVSRHVCAPERSVECFWIIFCQNLIGKHTISTAGIQTFVFNCATFIFGWFTP